MWDYTDKVRDHFLNPRNAGPMEDPTVVGEVGSLACGDALKLFLKIDPSGRITDATFQTFGCASAIASSSVLTELLKGKTVEEAAAITNKEIAAELGGLPREKMHCSVMGQEALESALKRYRGELEPLVKPEGEIVCKCFGVTDVQIRRAITENNLTTVEEITDYTKAGGGCGECVLDLERILAETRGTEQPKAKPETAKRKLTNLQRMQLVAKVIDEEIRPSLKKDRGDIELLDIEGTRVLVSMRGACAGCPSSQLTIKELIQRRLRDAVDQEIIVEEVRS
ncbi:NifU-like protein [Desulfonatronum thiosulfatophilum]|uniref:Nitrogen fixation protein NifU n=1 Tax=Desulfonatronum thiosulfatophilum TaxID=617002 RepID=A0A1G6CSK4_9BACT|nr:Fe-S cluster assembly protein NifU [Desulfonatronum thiosulfatophilum]SDB35870.1 NifU-like protein [Desulfonatronum thiosulfatophilum]